MMEALHNDEWRMSVNLGMAFLAGGDTDERMELLVKSLPSNLKTLNLDLRGTEAANESIQALAVGLPRGLECYNLDLGSNPKINNHGIEGMITKLPPKLNKIRLELNGTSSSKDIQEKKHSLDELKQHVVDEAEKGNWCTTVSLCPSPTGRMVLNSLNEKC